MKFKNQRGFTLIEILIVVAIIGMLSSIVLVGLGSFRARGRDARRVADIKEIQNALELSYARYGEYQIGSNIDTNALTLVADGIGVTKIPSDPSGGNYKYGSDGQGYVLGAELEEDTAAVLDDDIDNDTPAAERFSVDCGSATLGEDTIYCVKF